MSLLRREVGRADKTFRQSNPSIPHHAAEGGQTVAAHGMGQRNIDDGYLSVAVLQQKPSQRSRSLGVIPANLAGVDVIQDTVDQHNRRSAADCLPDRLSFLIDRRDA